MTHADAIQRLDTLEGYLRHDPNNAPLLADAFDVALQAGEWARAEFHLRHAQALGADALAWGWREAHWHLAQHQWDEAGISLRALAAHPGLTAAMRPMWAHDMAYLALRRGDFAAGLEQLAPWVEPVGPAEPLDPALQVLWLRLAHRLNRHQEAMAWARARWQAGQLAAPASGVASLIALDADEALLGLQWAEHALHHDGEQQEALVARATLALAENNAALSRGLLERALSRNADDGRALSALAFTDLLDRRLDAACDRFRMAVQRMPGHIGTWHGLGWALLLQGRLDEARHAFETALDLDRNFGESHGGLAVALAMQGLPAEAEQSIERALRLDRAGMSAQYARAVLRGEARDPQAIRQLATRLLGSRIQTPLP
jgi:Flp pilus assembly protein TadD